MRRHSVWYRVLVAVWGMWLAVALCEPMELHACPMHDAMSSMAGMPGMSMPAAPQAAAHEQSGPTVFAVCTCLTCCGTSTVAAPEPIVGLPEVHAAPASTVPRATALWTRISRAYALPLATAPPLAASLI